MGQEDEVVSDHGMGDLVAECPSRREVEAEAGASHSADEVSRASGKIGVAVRGTSSRAYVQPTMSW